MFDEQINSRESNFFDKLTEVILINFLHQQALIAVKQGHYEKGIHLAEKARQLGKDVLGSNNHNYAILINNLAELYKAMGRFTDAEDLWLQAMEIIKAKFGETNLNYVAIINNLATMYLGMKRLDEAERFFLKVKEILKAQLGETNLNYTTSLNNLVTLYHTMGRFKDAELFGLEAKKIIKINQGKNNIQYAIILHSLASLYRAMGRFNNAELFYRKAKNIWEELSEENHPDYATTLNNLGALCLAMGRFAEAEGFLRQAKEIRKAKLGENHTDYATSLNNLAQLYRAMGRFTDVEHLYLQAMEIFKAKLLENNPDYATSLNNLADLYREMGRFTDSENFYLQAKEIKKDRLGENNPSYATTLNNLAQLYGEIGRFAQAELLFQDAIKIRKAKLGENHPDYASSLHNLGALYYAMVRFAKAEPLLLKAKKICKAQLGENHPDYATSLNSLAELYRAMGRFAKAAPLFQDAMEIRKAQLGENHPHYAISLNNLAGLMAGMNRPQEALSLMQEAAKIQNRTIGEILSISSDRQRLEYLRQNYYQLEVFLSLVNQYFPHDPAAKQAALDLVLRRKSLATEAGILLRTLIVSGRYPHLMPQLDELRQLHHQIAYVTWQIPTSPEGRGEYWQRLADLNRKKDELEQFLSRQIPEMNLQQQLDNANRQAIAATLPKGSTLVELVQFRVGNFLGVEANGDAKWLPARYLAFILPAGESERVEMVDLGDAGEIDELCRQFRRLASEKPSENPGEKRVAAVFDDDESAENKSLNAETWIYPEVGKQLYAKLIQPLKPYLPHQQTVYLSPDGELAIVPFGILSADGTVELMQEYQLRYLNVGRDILRFNVEIPVEYSPPLVIANPDYNLRLDVAEETSAKSADLSQGESSVDFGSLSRELGRGDGEVFKPLPGSKIEGERIAQLLGVPVYTEAQAVKSLLSQSRSPKIVHIATHGYFLEVDKSSLSNADNSFDFASWGMMSRFNFANLVNPLTRSGLAFAGANTALKAGKIPSYAEDGLLTAQGAMVLDFTGTALVVLSACDTALGNKAIGEGVIGLRRSFIVAGAETLVMSLWKVPDIPTAILMERLYHNLLQKQLERTAALEDAQAYLRTLNVGEMRKIWLTEAAIEQVGLVSDASAVFLINLSKKADNFQPFSLPYYWAAFVCIGDHRKMRN